MNTSHESEANSGEATGRTFSREHRDKILPVNHMLSRHVRRVVSRILAANNLGVVRGDDMTFSSYIDDRGGTGGDGWDPDAELGVGRGREEREWTVMVVNDPKLINAFVLPGIGSTQCVIRLLIGHPRAHCRLYWNSTHMSKRTRSRGCPLPWYVPPHLTVLFPHSPTLRNRTRRSAPHSLHV
jgi:hypothetical protein